jgi:micrococcal nuclease
MKVGEVFNAQSIVLHEEGSSPPPTADKANARLIGIEAPDLDQNPWGGEARDRLQAILAGPGEVRVEIDVQERDRYGRMLVYLWKNGQLVNSLLVKEGFVLASNRAPNLKYSKQITAAQQYARIAGKGIWNPDRPLRLTPAEFRERDRQRN